MRFVCFWPLFFVTLLVTFLVSVMHHNATAGAFSRCDIAESCTADRALRLNNSWLCCEDDSGWVAAHILHPMAIALFSGSPSLTVIAYFYFEALEANAITLFRTFVFVPADPANLETLAGSLIGDAQLNGSYGLLLAVAVAQFVGWHGFGYYYWRGSMQSKVAAKYLLLYVLFAASFGFVGLHAGTTNYGAAIATVVQLVLVLVVIPRCIRPGDVAGVELAESYRRLKWLWALALVLIAPTGFEWRYFANMWYQAWLPTVVLILFFKLFNMAAAASAAASAASSGGDDGGWGGGDGKVGRRRNDAVAKVDE